MSNKNIIDNNIATLEGVLWKKGYIIVVNVIKPPKYKCMDYNRFGVVSIMRLLRNSWIISFFMIILLFSACSSTQVKPIQAEKGILDLSRWDFDKGGVVKLNGEWELYWEQFLEYKDFELKRPDILVDVPNTWNKYSLNGKKLQGEGYATYRLHIKTSLPEGTMMGLRVFTFSSAYNLYVNEKLVASNGKAMTEASGEIGEYRPQAVFFNIPAREFDISIQVSNFQYARGGFWYPIFMGSAEGITSLHANTLEKESFLLGVLAILSLFYLSVFIFQRELKYSLYFACFCLTMALVLDAVGQFILLSLFPWLSLKFVIFIWYSSTIWVIFFLISYMDELFKSRLSIIVRKAYLGFAIVAQIIFIFTSNTFYTKYGSFFGLVEILGGVCTIIIAAVGITKGKKDGWLNIASMSIVIATYIHDDLYWMNIITNSFGEIIYGGLFLFISLQMFIQAKRIDAFHNSKSAAELSFLQAQIKPHFLFNTLNTFISISRYDMEKARTLLYDFSNYLRRSFDFKDLSQFVSLKHEIELAKAYVDIEKARFEEQVDVNFEIPEDLEYRVPILMLQPLIENAIIHGVLPKLEGGRVDITIQRQEKNLVFRVRDNGMGMDVKKVLETCQNDIHKGVGIANINSRLKKLYRKGLQIISSPENGTEITWHVPINLQGRIEQSVKSHIN